MKLQYIISCAALTVAMSAASQQTVSIKTTDHDINIPVEQLKSIEFNDDEFTEIVRVDTVMVDSSKVAPTGFVDLGLPSGTKWASLVMGSGDMRNNFYHYGASLPSDQIMTVYTNPLTKFYCNPQNHNTQLCDIHNVVKMTYGANYDMPTSAQVQELIDNTTVGFVADTLGVSGYRMTSNINGNSIFIDTSVQMSVQTNYGAGLVPENEVVCTERKGNNSNWVSIWTKDFATDNKGNVSRYAASVMEFGFMGVQKNSKSFDTFGAILPVYNATPTPVLPDTEERDVLASLNNFVDLGLPSGTKWSSQYLGDYTENDINSSWDANTVSKKAKYSWGIPYAVPSCDNVGYGVEYAPTMPAAQNAVYSALGLGYDIPTSEQFLELINPEYTTITVNKYNSNVSHITITSKVNGNCLILENQRMSGLGDGWGGRNPNYTKDTPVIWLKDATGKKDGIYGTFLANAGFFLDTPDGGYYNPAKSAGVNALPAWFAFPILPVYNGGFVDSYTGIKLPQETTCGFEDSEGTILYGADLTKQVEKNFSELIDETQYGGTFLYGEEAPNYVFKDPRTGLITGLRTVMNKIVGLPAGNSYGDAFWSGGAALSNYWRNTWAGGGYNDQLTFYSTEENKKETALMLYGYLDNPIVEGTSYDSRPILAFEEDAQILTFDVYFPTYLLHSLMEGDGFNTPATDDTKVSIVVEGFDENHNSTGKVSRTIFNKTTKNNFISGKASAEKRTINTSLIPASRYYMINYAVTDDQKGGNGLNMPAYIGIDNVKVKKFVYQK